ncbi:MAG TPA: hypothetical protein VFE01_05570 [Terracidiphilus sp.]|nr:hypothetical protein [Terracidiphilus sp.]
MKFSPNAIIVAALFDRQSNALSLRRLVETEWLQHRIEPDGLDQRVVQVSLGCFTVGKYINVPLLKLVFLQDPDLPDGTFYRSNKATASRLSESKTFRDTRNLKRKGKTVYVVPLFSLISFLDVGFSAYVADKTESSRSEMFRDGDGRRHDEYRVCNGQIHARLSSAMRVTAGPP